MSDVRTLAPLMFLALNLFSQVTLAQSTIFLETFETALAPGVPQGWALSEDSSWATSSSVASNGSGGNNLVHAGSQPGRVATRALDLSGVTSATFSYLARRTGTYDRAHLRVTASTDGGASFPVVLLDAGAALPEAVSSYEEITADVPAALLRTAQVVLRFEASGGSSGSANIRLDDVKITGSRSSTATGDQFGFATASSHALEETALIEIPLALSLSGETGLQGLQFSIAWDDAAVQFVDVARGPALADAGAWHLYVEPGEKAVQVLLLAEAEHSLPPGLHDPLLVLQVTSGAISPEEERTVHFALDGLVGASAVATGADAGLVASQAGHTLTLTRRAAFFDPSTPSLDLGQVEAGRTGEATLRVSNAGGTKLLTIREVTSSDPSFAVSPASATVPPEGEQVFTVTFAPAPEGRGLQAATLHFAHDGENGPVTEVVVTAEVTSGRGDADGDGMVDVVDLVLAIDFILGRVAPDDRQHTAVDLSPFPEGDGLLDVRDLTVLVHAIARGSWPDEVALPAVRAHAAGTAAKNAASQPVVEAHLTAQDTSWVLQLDHAAPIRALQLVLEVEGAAAAPNPLLDAARAADMSLRTGFDPEAQVVRILLFRADGGMIPPGQYPLVAIPRAGREGSVTPRYAVAVDESRSRVPVTVEALPATGAADDPLIPDHYALEQPYPNPFQAASGGVLQIPVAFAEAGQGHLAVYDVLGRQVATLLDTHQAAGRATIAWDGRDDQGRPVAPGLYVIRLAAGAKYNRTRAVVMMR